MTTVTYTRRLVEHRYGRSVDELRRGISRNAGRGDDPVLPIVLRRLSRLADTGERARATRRKLDVARLRSLAGEQCDDLVLLYAAEIVQLERQQRTEAEAVWDLLDVRLLLDGPRTPSTSARQKQTDADIETLMPAARQIAAALPRLTRDTLRSGLRDRGVHASNRRLGTVLRRLRAEGIASGAGRPSRTSGNSRCHAPHHHSPMEPQPYPSHRAPRTGSQRMTASTSALGDLSPDTAMLVEPVFLAGRGESTAVHGALCDRGWGKAITSNGLLFTNPRHDVLVSHLSEETGRCNGWKIAQHREPLGMPLWSVSFSDNTPAEIVTAVCKILEQATTRGRRDPRHTDPASEDSNPVRPLVERGWEAADTALYLYYRSPDGHAYFRERSWDLDDYEELGGGPAHWSMYSCVDSVNGERWYADFTSVTPRALVSAATRAMSSADPVERPLCAIPERNLSYVTVRLADAQRPPLRSAAVARTSPHRQQSGGPPPSASSALDPQPAPRPSRRRS